MSNDTLMHYGTPRHSGRYPWGSGKNPYQRNASFVGYYRALKKEGLTDAEIAKGMGMTTKELLQRYSIAKDEKRIMDREEALRLKDKGYSNVAIGKRMGIGESTVRNLLDPILDERAKQTRTTAQMLKDELKTKKYLDVGVGTENYLEISRTKLETALELLKQQGYEVHNIKSQQLGTGNFTTIQVLCPPGTNRKDIERDKIGFVDKWSGDGGKTWSSLEKPVSISSDRVQIRYKEDGGADKDGVIELRRGVEDIALGQSKYAQVRIGVDDTHYLKGMAIYSDSKMPKGVDIIFNTNKSKDVPKKDVMKPMEKDPLDPNNPFGASIKQRKYIDKNGKEKLSAINIVNEEGDWAGWKKTLSSQVLSKQHPELAEKQLALRFDDRKAQYDSIMALTNPTLKKFLLPKFADECETSSVHLEAAAMPRQASHVIIPINSLRDNEIYAPKYRDGESVVLIRYPHGGKFEIPELKVNNSNPEGKRVITNKAQDAVGINSKVAGILSGADFDGDTVLVIPNKKGNKGISTSSPLEGLKNFDPKELYSKPKPSEPLTKKEKTRLENAKQKKMGEVSNLITDMTIKGANDSEICRAVKHSMVVIDSVKHNLDVQQSYKDNGIAELSKKYQGKARGGASTLISKASSEARVERRKERGVDKETGKKIYVNRNDNVYYDRKTGKQKIRTTKSTKMAEVDDAFELSSGTKMESIYATHANKLKSLANQARKDAVNMKGIQQSKSAEQTYKREVDSLMSKLNIAMKHKPLERQATLLSNVIVDAKKKSNPYLDNDDLKKIRNQALAEARSRVGSKKSDFSVKITDKEWEAIQAGAISHTKLTKILNNTDLDRVRELATPKQAISMTPAKIARAKAMLNAGCTQAEVADILGISVSTLSKALK